jgi:hypothetical protein
MAFIRTFTVTVSGGKYYIDSVQQPTINLAEGGLYKFDVSDSSNENHDLRFSTTSDGTHAGGSVYTTGVDNSGTPGDADAYLQIQVATSAPDPLYYYDTNNSGLGGQANTPAAASYGMRAWSINSWGAQNEVDVSLTAPSELTSSIGDVAAYPEQGWGSDTWGTEDWGESGLSFTISGVSATASVGDIVASSLQGWGRAEWGEEPWGDSNNPTVSLTGLGATSSIGEVSAFNEQGWGRDPWGYENWGESAMTVVVDVDSSGVATTGVGAISPSEMSIGLSGQGTTSSVGTPGLEFGPAGALSGVSATVSVGSVDPVIVVPLSGIALTSSVGAIAPADVMGLTGVSATASPGEITVASVELVDVTGVGATSAVGSISLAAMSVGLTGQSLTSSTGSISPTEMTMGLTGQSATISLGQIGGPIAWEKVTPTQGGSWSKRTATQGGSWSKKTPSQGGSWSKRSA